METKPVAIIPARAGSKRIPDKNIRMFCGKPLISYSIKAALESGIFGRVVVSTDSEKIAGIARDCGAVVPFNRPPELSGDFTTTAEVLVHAVGCLGGQEGVGDYFCCIYATAPFIQASSLKKGFELLKKSGAQAAFTVTTYPYPIFRSLKIKEDGRLEMFWPQYADTRSNDLPAAYHDAGQFYWVKTGAFLEKKALLTADALPVIIPRHLTQDIDTEEDWQAAEKLYLAFKNEV